MAWAINTPDGGQVRLTDLPLAVLGEIEAETETKWLDVITAPAQSIPVVTATYRAACAHVGVEPQELTAAEYIDSVLERVDDDMPTTYGEGIPKAEGGPQTSGSSGAPNDTGGPQP